MMRAMDSPLRIPRRGRADAPGSDPFAAGHDRAYGMFAGPLRVHPHLPDQTSRICELIEHYGWETGHKAEYCTPWRFEDDPRWDAYREAMGLDPYMFRILHMYALINRLDPDRHDLFWIYDGLLARLDELGGPGELSVLDFGSGIAQSGLAFALAGYRTVCCEMVGVFVDFFRFMCDVRNVEPVIVQSEHERDYYESGADGHRYGLVIEWSVFEHIYDVIEAVEKITAGLVPGGMFVTTTLCRDWDDEAEAHFRRDTQDERIIDQVLSGEVDEWLRERFEVLSPAKTLAKVLVKR
jgi:SAM-dependent methyltransferase